MENKTFPYQFSHAPYVLSYVLFSDDGSKIHVLISFRTTILVFHINLATAITIPWYRRIPEEEIISFLVYT